MRSGVPAPYKAWATSTCNVSTPKTALATAAQDVVRLTTETASLNLADELEDGSVRWPTVLITASNVDRAAPGCADEATGSDLSIGHGSHKIGVTSLAFHGQVDDFRDLSPS